ncbi:MAG: hypothetical protein EAZ85_11835 [Bacteroidetes bacterium]|nr:MAG: hypothetical protein EAZ85_11835 [Bacteroidota bacterium]TAG86446.1 MAG: hypothetical protein EAZ20_12770 [Bacteroidota bacterium]
MKKIFLVIFYCIFFYFQSFFLIAQNPYLRAINYPYQLSANVIYDMHIDKIGRIWLGTDKGLFRFNGKNAQKIPFIDATQMELTNLQEDEKGRIWGHNFASQIFFLENDTLRLFEIPTKINFKASLNNYVILKNNLWISSISSFVKINIVSKKIEYEYQLDDNQSYISDMILFQNKEIHICSPILKQYFIISVDANTIKNNLKIIPLPLETESRLMPTKDKVYGIQKQHSKRIMAVFEKNKWTKFPEITQIDKKIPVYHLSKTDEKDIWICTKEGGFKWNMEKNMAELYFPNKNVTDVVRDYQGNYWISTLDSGLLFCPSLATKVYNPLPFLSEKQEVFTQIQKDDKTNNIWLGTSKGRFYSTTLESEKEKEKEKEKENIKVFENDYLREVTRLFPNHDKIWTNSGIFDKNKTKNSISLTKLFPKDFRFYQNKYVLAATAHFGCWTIPFEKINKDVQKNTDFNIEFTDVSAANFPIKYLTKRRAYSVELDTIRKKYWVAYDNDLYEYDFKGNSKVIKTKDNKSIVARRMAIDKDGKLYIASFSQGILIIDNQRVIHQLNDKKGLKTNITRAIKNVRDTIWISTDEEIGYLMPQTFALIDILNDNAVGKISYQDFYPDNEYLLLAMNTNIISLPINRTVVGDKLNYLPLKKQGSIFSPTFTIEILSYKNPLQTKIYYRLKGIEKEWQNVQDLTTTIKYNNLKYGTYTFEFYGIDEISNIKSEISQTTFEVPKKWYETYIFQLIVLVFILFCIYFIILFFLEKNKEKQSQKEKLLISQLVALRSQMNPHFLYNILNTVQGLVYSNLKKEAGELLGNFSDLMRKSLQASENTYIDLRDEIDILQLYIMLEKSRFDNNFSYIFDVEQVRDCLSAKIPSMLIQPFVENAFKHGLLHKQGIKKLFIQFFVINENILKIVIDDNGVGREKSAEINQKHKQKSTGFATKTTEKRLELLNYQQKNKIKLNIIDKIEGTKVEIFIPFV